jgi:hypothetical protein
MNGRCLVIETGASDDGQNISDDSDSECDSLGVLSFTRSAHDEDEDDDHQLQKLLNTDFTLISDTWFQCVTNFLQDYPPDSARLKEISLTLLGIIKSAYQQKDAAPNSPSKDAKKRQREKRAMEKHVIYSVSPGDACKVKPHDPIPFEIGMQLLQGAYQGNDGIGEGTRKAVQEIEHEAGERAAVSTGKDEEIRQLRKKIDDWRMLAKTRLFELKKEFEARERVIFGNIVQGDRTHEAR